MKGVGASTKVPSYKTQTSNFATSVVVAKGIQPQWKGVGAVLHAALYVCGLFSTQASLQILNVP